MYDQRKVCGMKYMTVFVLDCVSLREWEICVGVFDILAHWDLMLIQTAGHGNYSGAF